jgi:hypothetical protein
MAAEFLRSVRLSRCAAHRQFYLHAVCPNCCFDYYEIPIVVVPPPNQPPSPSAPLPKSTFDIVPVGYFGEDWLMEELGLNISALGGFEILIGVCILGGHGGLKEEFPTLVHFDRVASCH